MKAALVADVSRGPGYPPECAIQQQARIAEIEVSRAAQRRIVPPGGQAVVNRLNVSQDLTIFGAPSAGMIRHQKHKGAVQAGCNDRTAGRSIDVNSCFAARVFMAEFRSGSASEGVPEDADLFQVEMPLEPMGGIGLIQLGEAIQQKTVICSPNADRRI